VVGLTAEEIRRWGEKLLRAYETGPVDPLSQDHPDASVSDAYAIQSWQIHARVTAGDRVVGHKIGLTSRAMQDMLGVDQPDYGRLLASMVWDPDGIIGAPLWQPRVEPEIAFVLARPLEGDAVTPQDVLNATAYVCPALEIIDSRIRNWQIRLLDTVADNASSGGLVLGAPRTLGLVGDLAALGVTLEKNGQVVQTGTGSAVLGHPAIAVAWLARTLTRLGERLDAGHIVLSGSATAAVTVTPGDLVRTTIEGLGSVSAYFSPKSVS